MNPQSSQTSRAWSVEASRLYLEQLARTVYTHEALNNAFFELWTGRRLELSQVSVFVRNYGQFNRSFPEVLATVLAATDNIAARTEYAKTLYSEMGYGNYDKVHSVLFDAWAESLAEQFGDRKAFVWSNLIERQQALPQTRSLIDGQIRLYAQDGATASGAQLALEWQAYTMQCQLYEGARRYMGLWPRKDEFHEACEFFYAHIGAAEKEHKNESLNAAVEFDVDEASRARLVAGFNEQNHLFAQFWGAIGKAMN